MENLSAEKIIYFLVYLVIINIASFLSMMIDKKLAIHKKRRISEKSLFTLALLFGSIGSIAGMYTFRHKTKHLSFTIGMPLILVFNIVIMYLMYKYNLFN